MKEQIADIFLRRLDSYVNPKVENRVIYGNLIFGVSLIIAPKLLALIGSISIRTESYEINIKNSQLDDLSIFIGFVLILIAVLNFTYLKSTSDQNLL